MGLSLSCRSTPPPQQLANRRSATLFTRCAAEHAPYPPRLAVAQRSRGERMGRGGAQQGSPSPVPVLRALRAPGGGFNHKKLNATTTAPFQPVERSRSPVKDIGARNRRGRANVGVSNRRTTSMPVEVGNAPARIPANIGSTLQPRQNQSTFCQQLLRCFRF